MLEQKNNDSKELVELRKYAKLFILKKRKLPSEVNNTGDDNRYVIYARKSTEDEKRQVQSIEDQVENCKKFAQANKLQVVDIVREEKSAKTAGHRTKFLAMLQEIQSGDKYNSIIAWHPDRLARNMKESGEILDMLDNEIIKDLKFPSYTFNNDAGGKMTLSILFAMAKEFSDKLSEDTKRGINKKVRDGKHCGVNKRGYIKSATEYYRRDEDTFDLYANTWKDYIEGKSQIRLVSELKEKGLKINKNSLSNMFQDPFYAGMYCFGDQVIDMRKVDQKFPIMVTPSEFLTVQKMSTESPRGWRITEDFRPFYELVICKDCGKVMTSGLSSGHKEKYLSVTCGNSKCREKRKMSNIQPIANTIRGKTIIEATVAFITQQLKTTKKLYERAKTEYLRSRDSIIKELKESIRINRSQLAKSKEKSTQISNKVLEFENVPMMKAKWSEQLDALVLEENELKLSIKHNEKELFDIESTLIQEFPSYEQFVNFFKSAVNVVQRTDDAYLIDRIVKLVFVNITAGDKKVVKMEVREPFKSFAKLKNTIGVADGI